MKRVFKKGSSKKINTPPTRITNETVAEHREQILAGARKFKYPVQYAKHKLVINTIIIGVVFVLAAVGVTWHQLYVAQVTNGFFYRVTRTLPLPVANVDGQTVRYSDYLMRYRIHEHWLSAYNQAEQGEADNERQSAYLKRATLDSAQLDAYALKLAKELDITVSEEEIDTVVARSLQTPTGTIPQESYDAYIQDSIGRDREEYRLLLKQSILREKVAYEIDDEAKRLHEQVAPLAMKDGSNFADIAKDVGSGIVHGQSGVVRISAAANLDGGLTQAASELKVGEVSGPLRSTTADGYYFIRVLTRSEQQLSYESIKIPLKTFNSQYEKIKKDGKIREYISLEEVSQQNIE